MRGWRIQEQLEETNNNNNNKDSSNNIEATTTTHYEYDRSHIDSVEWNTPIGIRNSEQ
jgi:hypothetical protein